jgi:Malic enzyme, N-terminal domain/Malic enzyme, NAD binding domain
MSEYVVDSPTLTAEVVPPPVDDEAAIVQPSASYSIVMRVRLSPRPGSFGRVATAIGETGATLGAIDLVRVEKGMKIRDITVACIDASHGERVAAAVGAIEGVTVHDVLDRTFQLHLGGKIEVTSTVPLKSRDDLSMAYTPGVARICSAIHDDVGRAWELTIKGNTVAVISDGTAVLGLGDIGPEAAMPVMEGKALLFKEFAGIDAFPLCLGTTDVDEIVNIVRALAPTFGAINLEDIAAPRCFEIERRLRAELNIPVFHDDQHGTAIVVLAALLNALRVVGKRVEDTRIVVTGAGAAGLACTNIILAEGRRTSSCATSREPCTAVGQASTASVRCSPSAPTPGANGVWPTSCSRGPTSISECPGQVLSRRPPSVRWRPGQSSSPWPIPRPRCSPKTSAATFGSWPPGDRTTRTRSTMCSPSLVSSEVRWTFARARSTRR